MLFNCIHTIVYYESHKSQSSFLIVYIQLFIMNSTIVKKLIFEINETNLDWQNSLQWWAGPCRSGVPNDPGSSLTTLTNNGPPSWNRSRSTGLYSPVLYIQMELNNNFKTCEFVFLYLTDEAWMKSKGVNLKRNQRV